MASSRSGQFLAGTIIDGAGRMLGSLTGFVARRVRDRWRLGIGHVLLQEG
jgi:hypothetical protein